MSRRRQAWALRQAVPADELAAMHYGVKRARDPADATVVREVDADHEWAEAVCAMALAVGGFALVVTAWALSLPWLARLGVWLAEGGR